MKNFRIFIENLPETATESVIKNDFQQFLDVESVEIKERKNVTHKHTSCFFAYINVKTDEHKLQKCFEHFNRNSWLGQYVKLQLAKESFLERLKRERESKTIKNEVTKEIVKIENGNERNKFKRKISCSSSDTEEEVIKIDENKEKSCSDSEKEELKIDIVIRNNKNVKIKEKLKIEGVGNEPIHKIELGNKKKKSLDKFRTQADCKRIDSVLEKKKSYQNQQNLIKAALSYSNINKSNRIIFDEKNEQNNSNSSKLKLFDGNSEDEGEDLDTILKEKEKFQGKSGEKLLKLQSKFKNDSRFKLDEKFLEEENDIDDIDSLNIEKTKQLEILNEILGEEAQVNTTDLHRNEPQKIMRRFDPSREDHHKYERKREKIEHDSKKTRKLDEEKPNEIPEVSKEIFYKLDETFKETLEINQNFSLLNMFGDKTGKTENEPEEVKSISLKNNFDTDNPFKFDSSDDEDQTEQLKTNEKPLKIWNEPFFFQDDDFRFQEGVDFVKKIATATFVLDEKSDIDNVEDFNKLRRNLKEIVKTKLRNNMRKHKMFKKKLGGSRKKKMKRMEKALKR